DLARVRAAQARLSNVQQPLGREAERKAAQSEVAAARAALAQAAWKLEQKSVAAPAGGRVHDTYFAEGEWVPAGRPVVALLPPGNVKVRFYVPETLLGAIAGEHPVEIRCDGCPAPVAGKVSFVSTQAEYTPPVLYSRESRSKLVYLVEARPEGGNLRPGQPVDVTLK
ncbi:MAG TPA: HlyD family efflux transporter periplasmic adaptor subunit, partial [Burkholderiales bacterium]|nr:HlyD family efflux transporter periplasmic adaptor subunit [Burkholderiales bacterium]